MCEARSGCLSAARAAGDRTALHRTRAAVYGASPSSASLSSNILLFWDASLGSAFRLCCAPLLLVHLFIFIWLGCWPAVDGKARGQGLHGTRRDRSAHRHTALHIIDTNTTAATRYGKAPGGAAQKEDTEIERRREETALSGSRRGTRRRV
jgi:hypothetical protein